MTGEMACRDCHRPGWCAGVYPVSPGPVHNGLPPEAEWGGGQLSGWESTR
jgi:hypothetical protein